jgi:DNA-binding NarL/FixJ family response regulator
MTISPTTEKLLTLLVSGKSNRQIAEAMHTTEQVVKNRLQEIYFKLESKKAIPNRQDSSAVRVSTAIWWERYLHNELTCSTS